MMMQYLRSPGSFLHYSRVRDRERYFRIYFVEEHDVSITEVWLYLALKLTRHTTCDKNYTRHTTCDKNYATGYLSTATKRTLLVKYILRTQK